MLSIVKKGLQVREVFFMLSVLVFQLQYRFCVLPEKTTLIWLSCGHMVTYLLGYSEHAKVIHADLCFNNDFMLTLAAGHTVCDLL